MAGKICPWWLGYLLVTPLRRFYQDPQSILQPFVSEGMQVLEPGCGMGYFTLPLARLVGERGRVIAVDIQPKMIAALRKRARKVRLDDRIDARIAKDSDLGLHDLDGKVDFALVFAVVHELPDEAVFSTEMHRVLKPGGKILVAEPKGHVKEKQFAASVEIMENAGFHVAGTPQIRRSWTAVLER